MNSVLNPQPAKTKAAERPASLKTKSASPAQKRPSKKAAAAAAAAAESSESEHEGPVAQQMLSFVMDDPDFDSEDQEVTKPKKKVKDVEMFFFFMNCGDSHSSYPNS